jgi:hypothetical protein
MSRNFLEKKGLDERSSFDGFESQDTGDPKY